MTNVPACCAHACSSGAAMPLRAEGSIVADATTSYPEDPTTLGAADVPALAQRGVVATNVMDTPTPDKLAGLAEQAASGDLQVPIQQTFALADARAAIAAFAAGTRGKIVLDIG